MTEQDIQRREFLRKVGAGLVGGALVQSTSLGNTQTQPASRTRPHVPSLESVPRRQLGRIPVKVSPLALGCAVMGHAYYKPAAFEEVTEAAIQAGVNYLDVARLYDVAEERLKPVLARHRKKLFLVTKTWARNRDDALRSLDKSLTMMGVDHVDLCHMHNVGQYTKEEALGKGGLLDGLLEAKKRGLIKHIGCSGHQNPDKFIPVLETGEIELVMLAMNYVDRHTYNFEQRVVPLAVEKGCAIVAMKVYGGVTGGWDGYRKRRPGRLAVEDQARQDAIDYAMSIPGISTCVIGLKTLGELTAAIEAFRNHRQLAGQREEKILARGEALAQEWGPHFGPVS